MCITWKCDRYSSIFFLRYELHVYIPFKKEAKEIPYVLEMMCEWQRGVRDVDVPRYLFALPVEFYMPR